MEFHWEDKWIEHNMVQWVRILSASFHKFKLRQLYTDLETYTHKFSEVFVKQRKNSYA